MNSDHKTVYPQPYHSGLITSIDLGIKESKGEIIIATDADCRVGSLWIASMTYSLINKT